MVDVLGRAELADKTKIYGHLGLTFDLPLGTKRSPGRLFG